MVYVHGGMQILKQYKAQCAPKFLEWYLKEFRSERMMYLHWSAGYPQTNFKDYHIVICEEHGVTVTHYNTPANQDLPAHTYQRNMNSCAIAIACAFGATTKNLGQYPPSSEQIKEMLNQAVRICLNQRIPVGNILSHAEAADNEDGATGLEFYGPKNGCERWDFWVGIDPKTLRVFCPSVEVRTGSFWFPDWFRGEAILRIQKATEKYWK